MKFFKNSDGTLNTVNIFVVVTVITFALLFLLCKNIIFGNKLNKIGNVISTTTTTTWNLCKDCAISFKNDSITMEAGTNEKIKNIIELKNVNLTSIKFSSSNKDIVSIKTIESDISLVAGNEVGTATITAEYDDKKVELTVNVKASKVTEAKFADKVYYAYIDKKTPLKLNTLPKNAPNTLVTFKSDDEDIGYFDEENNFIGKNVGEVKIQLINGEATDDALVYVIRNKVTIKVKDNGTYTEMKEYEYPSNIDSFIELCVKIEDNYSEGYNQDSISSQVISTGKITTTISSEGEYSLDTNAYIFKAHVKIDQADDSTDNYSIITFSLPDGSKAQIKITK